MSITEQLVNSVCKSAKKICDCQVICRFLWNPKVYSKFKRIYHWFYLEPHVSSRQAHTWNLEKKKKLNVIIPSTLKYTKFSLFSTVLFLQKPSMYLSFTQARHLLYISHPPRYSHAYNTWQKLKLWEAFRNVLISPVASSISRRHWHHRHAYRILRQIVAKRLVNPYSKSWSIVLHSNLTTHFKV